MHPIDMAVHDVEVGGRLGYRIELHGIGGERIRPRPAEAERARHNGDKCASVTESAACKQRDVMPRATSSSVSHETTRSVPP